MTYLNHILGWRRVLVLIVPTFIVWRLVGVIPMAFFPLTLAVPIARRVTPNLAHGTNGPPLALIYST